MALTSLNTATFARFFAFVELTRIKALIAALQYRLQNHYRECLARDKLNEYQFHISLCRSSSNCSNSPLRRSGYQIAQGKLAFNTRSIGRSIRT
jgi:hypothetical protein